VLRRSVESAQYTRSSSVFVAVRQAYAPRWARSATPCARASWQPSNASCLIGVGSRHRRSATCDLRIRRGLLQAAPPALLDRISLTGRLRASASRCGSHPRHTPACHRARGGQGQALRAAPRAAVLDRQGPNQRMSRTGGQHAVRSGSLIPNAQHSTKPGRSIQFGKGRHPPALNMGDCFAYACARANGARLLFKGEDFRRTDIEPAIP
jgi:hypothetical protein